MKYENKTISELKDICKKRDISGYSKLNKDDLIRLIKKHLPKKTSTKSKKLKGGLQSNDNTESQTTPKTTIIIMLFIGQEVVESGRIELDKIYTIDEIKKLTKNELQEILKKSNYYQTSAYQTYIILEEFIQKKKNKNNKFFNNIGSAQVTNNQKNRNTYMKHKLYKKYQTKLDNGSFNGDNKPFIVIALDESIIYSSKPCSSTLLTNSFKDIYISNFGNKRNEELKLLKNTVNGANSNTENTRKTANIKDTQQKPWWEPITGFF